MRKVSLPGTELIVSRLCLGTASLHHLRRGREQQELLATAADAGITHFDTARMYGEGMAERALGSFLAGNRSQFTIATKVGFAADALQESIPPLLYASRAAWGLARRLGIRQSERRRGLTSSDADASLTSSLRAMRTDWVDILFVHEPRMTEAGDIARLADWLASQKSSGRARFLGLSGIASDCVAIAQSLPGVFDVLQVEDSIDGREADVLTRSGRPLQLTFGYLRRGKPGDSGEAKHVVAQALRRNAAGAIVVSSRKPARLKELADVARGPDT